MVQYSHHEPVSHSTKTTEVRCKCYLHYSANYIFALYKLVISPLRPLLLARDDVPLDWFVRRFFLKLGIRLDPKNSFHVRGVVETVPLRLLSWPSWVSTFDNSSSAIRMKLSGLLHWGPNPPADATHSWSWRRDCGLAELFDRLRWWNDTTEAVDDTGLPSLLSVFLKYS